MIIFQSCLYFYVLPVAFQILVCNDEKMISAKNLFHWSGLNLKNPVITPDGKNKTSDNEW